jgi:hypothetical protein
MGRQTAGRKPVRIPYVSWRDGRPRFQPSATLRKLGYEGKDLRHGTPEKPGEWFTEGEATDWSNAFGESLQQRQEPPAPKGTTKRRPGERRGGKPRYGVTLRELVERYVTAMQEQIDTGHGEITARTLKGYDYNARYAERASPTLWESQADSITRPQIKSLHTALTRRHGLPTASHAVRALSLMFTWGMNEESVLRREVNPCYQLRVRQPKPRLRIGSLREIETLIAVADHLDLPFIADGIVLGLWTGQRQGDRLTLLHQSRDAEGRYRFRQSKTAAMVAIKPTAQLTARIEASLHRRAQRNAVYPHVLMNELTWEPMDQDEGERYGRLFRVVRKQAITGVRDEDGAWLIEPCPTLKTFTDQDLRDTSVTWMARGGASIPDICAVTGHSLQSATIILRHYLETNPEMGDRAIDAMVSYWEAEIEAQNRNKK